MDIQNLGNLLISKWGVRQVATNSGFFQPISISRFDASGRPVFNFDPTLRSTFKASPDLVSRWQLQFGFRYIF